MDDPAVRMAAFARQVQRAAFLVEGHAQFDQPVDRVRRALDHEFHRVAIVQPRARHHSIPDMILERVARVEHGGDAALRPRRAASGERALGEHEHLLFFGKSQRCGEARRTRPDDEDVVGFGHVPSHGGHGALLQDFA